MATTYTTDAEFTMAITLVKRGIVETLQEGRVGSLLRELDYVCSHLVATWRANVLIGPINDPENRPVWSFLKHYGAARRENRLDAPDFIEKARIIFPLPSGDTAKAIDETVRRKRKEIEEPNTGLNRVKDDQATKKTKFAVIVPAVSYLDPQSTKQSSTKDKNHKLVKPRDLDSRPTSKVTYIATDTTPEPSIGDLDGEEHTDTDSDIYYYAPGERTSTTTLESRSGTKERTDRAYSPNKDANNKQRSRSRCKPIPTRYIFTTGCMACVKRKRICRLVYRGTSCYSCATTKVRCEGIKKKAPKEVKDVQPDEGIDPRDVVKEVFKSQNQKKPLELPQSKTKAGTPGKQKAAVTGRNDGMRGSEKIPQKQLEREPMPARTQDQTPEQYNFNIDLDEFEVPPASAEETFLDGLLDHCRNSPQPVAFGTRSERIKDMAEKIMVMADRMSDMSDSMRVMANSMQVTIDDM